MRKIIPFALALALTSCATTNEKTDQEKKNRPSSGFVTLKFDVNQEGRAENIRVVEESPVGIFNKAAVKQLESRRFDTARARRSCRSARTPSR